MKVIKCGTMIVTKLSKVEGMITSISIDFDNILYNITYYDGDKFVNCKMHALEFDAVDTQKTIIGFRK